MHKLIKKGVAVSTLICSLLMYQGTYVKAAEVNNYGSNIVVSDSLRLQDDFYSVENRQWLNTAKIDIGQMSNSTFMETNRLVMEQKRQIIKELLANKNSYSESDEEKKIINLYNNTLNMDARNKQGIEPIKQMLDELRNIKTLKDISNFSNESNIENYLIQFSCDVDLKDATRHALYISPTYLSLGDSDEYIKPTENSKRIKGLTENYYNTILILSGYTKEAAKIKVDNLFKFENIIAESIVGKEENNKGTSSNSVYNIYTINQLDSLAPNLNIKTILKNHKLDSANKIVLVQPRWLKTLNGLYTEENLPMIKDYLEILNISKAAPFLTEDFEKASITFRNASFGSQGDISSEDRAINRIDSVLGEPLGKIYVQKYFSEETKQNVKGMTNEIIETYKKRINKLDWMSDSTKKSALEKLDKLIVHIGYPDKWDDYSNLKIRSFEEGGSLWENIKNARKFANDKSISQVNETVDKSKFTCTPQTINASYSATTNTITIPAGILQGELYNLNASKEKNLGAIGTVIGHEISHAFDTTGAKFDANGNLKSWWTLADYTKFLEKTNKVRAFYSKVKSDNGKFVNGDLTVRENIADIGGVACILDILKQMPNPDYKVFFESNAVMWREINTKEYEEYKLEFDAHSPNKVRNNIVLGQFDKFYETYGIKDGDRMYIKPEDRIQIW